MALEYQTAELAASHPQLLSVSHLHLLPVCAAHQTVEQPASHLQLVGHAGCVIAVQVPAQELVHCLTLVQSLPCAVCQTS